MTNIIENFAAACGGGRFLGFPHWYQYLSSVTTASDTDPKVKYCSPTLTNINDVWLILAAVIEIMIRIAALGAVAYVIYGGIIYITSQGEPDKTAKARTTITNALIGLAIAVIASSVVAYIAGRIN